jgi:glycosyltransferase involved in cell wall biosynthesis
MTKPAAREVFMLGWEYPPYVTGGVGQACFGLTRAMGRRGDRVLFVLPGKVAPAFEQATQDDLFDLPTTPRQAASVEVRGVGEQRVGAYAEGVPATHVHVQTEPGMDVPAAVVAPRRRPVDVAPPPDPVEEARRFAELAEELATKEVRRGFEVAHAHDWLTFEAGVRVSHRLRVPLVAHVHSTEHDRQGELADPRIMKAEADGLRAAAAVVCVSEYTAGVVAERYGIERSRLHVVHNAADDDPRFAPEPPVRVGVAEPVVVFLGRLARQKNPLGFVRAAAIVAEKDPAAVFVVAGSGELAEAARRLAEELGIAEKFLFAGYLRGEDVAQLFASAAVLVMPSVSEPFGLAGAEAMREGVPVVASATSGLASRFKNVLTADFSDDAAIAEQVLKLLEDDAFAADLSDRATIEVRQMKWSDAADTLATVYDTILP